MKSQLYLYVGSPEDDPFGTYVYLGLIIKGLGEYTLAQTERLDEISGDEVLSEIETLINKAVLAGKSLSMDIPVNSEEFVQLCVDLDCDEESAKNILKLIREFRKELKGVVSHA